MYIWASLLISIQNAPIEVCVVRVLMFGWEFPPYFAGGVGTVCYELTRELVSQGIDVDYVMPFFPEGKEPGFLRIMDASRSIKESEIEHVTVTRVPSLLAAYQTQQEYEQTLKQISKKYTTTTSTDNTRKMYGENLLQEIDLFAKRVAKMVEKGLLKDFDVIHAHDWTTVEAAVTAKRMTGKPLIVHCHITEINKNNGNGVNTEIYDAERKGFFAADKVIAVSNGIKTTLIEHYGVPPEKIEVIHNAGIQMNESHIDTEDFKQGKQVVSYLGRVTGMKGPEQFVEMASKVARVCPDTKFVMGGTGDRLSACVDMAKRLGVQDKFYFHGYYNREEAELFFAASDVFVMPSVMEPFGVVPLEAMAKNTPTVISKQSGVSEVIDHCFKVDFWDVDKMAAQVVSLLKYPILNNSMSKNGYNEAKRLNWKAPANKCVKLYGGLRAS